MLRYYVQLAARSFRKNKVLTALMIVAIALGLGASMTTLTVLHVLTGDPLPGRSGRIYRVQLEPRNMVGYTQGQEPPLLVSRRDGETLLAAGRAHRQALMTGGGVVIEPDEGSGLVPFPAHARYTSADFFPMFEAPLRYGRPWNAGDDDARARVVVISEKLNERLFGGEDSVGRSVRVMGTPMRVVGVLDHWRPTPHFYDLLVGHYSEVEEVFVPFSTSRALELGRNGNMDCWGETHGKPESLEAPCVWLQLWVELESPAAAQTYRDYLVSYSEEQRAAGRFERPTNVRLRDLTTWLDFRHVVPGDVRLQTWLALGFFLVCLLNTVGLLLAKFLRRSPEIGVRRALGASRRTIFGQLLCEAGAVGLAGGVLGLGLAWLGLLAVRHQPTEYAALAELDTPMLATTFAMALAASFVAGVFPAWRACRLAPARQLKSQ